jgi:signal peptidase II
VVVLDQVTKALAVAHLTEDKPTPLLGPVLRLDLTRNAGAAFSTATGFTWVLTLIAVAVVVFVVRATRRLGNPPWAVAFGLLLGGACGNLTDRLFRPPGFGFGHVVDFLEFPHWPIFNLADTSIVCAGALVVLLTMRGVSWERGPTGQVHTPGQSEQTEDTGQTEPTDRGDHADD